MESSEGSPLRDLAEAANRDFRHLFDARERTAAGLTERRASLGLLQHNPEASVVLMGSWGRAEVTAGSDDDFMVLIHDVEGSAVEPSIEAVSEVLDHAPSTAGPFAAPVFSDKLVEKIGLDPDDNKNLTRRMLFLLESVPVSGDDVYGTIREEILSRYLDQSVKAYRPPRFLLNDVVRYWRTICVDFAGKERVGPEKWGLRNAKLRASRKVLFAGGLLPVLECSRFELAPMRSFLEEQLAMPPTDRIAQAFLENEAVDAGARTLGAYDEFIGRMHEADFRLALQGVTRDNAPSAPAFSEVRRIGKELEAGLLALLYESCRELPKVVRDYAIF
jgi:hypothetical protein